MSAAAFFRARPDSMIDLRHPLAVQGTRIPCVQLEARLAPKSEHRDRSGQRLETDGLFGPQVQIVSAGISAAGRPRVPMRVMLSRLDLKRISNLSDEDLVARRGENVVWQHTSAAWLTTSRPALQRHSGGPLPQRHRRAGVEDLLKATIDTAVASRAVKPGQGGPAGRDRPEADLRQNRQDLASQGRRLRPRQAVQAPARGGEASAHDPGRGAARDRTQAAAGDWRIPRGA